MKFAIACVTWKMELIESGSIYGKKQDSKSLVRIVAIDQ